MFGTLLFNQNSLGIETTKREKLKGWKLQKVASKTHNSRHYERPTMQKLQETCIDVHSKNRQCIQKTGTLQSTIHPNFANISCRCSSVICASRGLI